jgi:hypothetical protein
MNVQSVHSDHSAHTVEAANTSSPPAPPTRAPSETTQHVDTVHATTPAANTALFQNAHTPTGTRVDTHR